jgi:hypothetical protein
LQKKKFDDKKDFKYTVQTKNKTASGLVFTTGGDFDSKNNVTGNLKLNVKRDFGEAEGSLSTGGPAKVEIKLKKLGPKGLVVTVTGDTAASFKKTAKFSRPTAKVAVEYSQDFIAGSASVETSFTKTNVLTGAVVIGFDGLSVGGEVKFDTDSKAREEAKSEIEDYNVGAEYAATDFTGTLKTSEQGNVLTASYIHKVSGDLTVGGEFKTKLDGSDEGRGLSVASEFKVDANTSVKLRGDTSKTAVVAVEHRLANPRVLIGAASKWGIDKDFSAPKPKDFGITFTFGDFDA